MGSEKKVLDSLIDWGLENKFWVLVLTFIFLFLTVSKLLVYAIVFKSSICISGKTSNI